MFTVATLEGLFTPRRIPPGVLNATGYFQATMGDVLDGYIDKICLVSVDGIVIWGETPEILLKLLLAVLDRLLERGILPQPTRPFSSERKSSGVGKSSPERR